MSAPKTKGYIISGCAYCGHSFTVGDNAQCVEPAVRRALLTQPGQFVHLHCLGTWTTLKAMERRQERAQGGRVKVVRWFDEVDGSGGVGDADSHRD